MTPDHARMLLHAYIDGELDAASAMELESQIAASAGLRQEMERLSALHDAVQTRGQRFTASPRLHDAMRAGFPRTRAKSTRSSVPSWRRAATIGTAVAATVFLLWSGVANFFGGKSTSGSSQEVVSAHIRSLMADHLTDFASAERHSVKPWLSTRLDFAPPVHEFSEEGFALMGARLDYIAGKPAAAIVYRHRQHIINVFVSPSPEGTERAVNLSTYRGYNTASFESGGMSYWIVSDLNQNDLGLLAKLFQSHRQ
jgi:anti-sigma factor RsiW